VAASSTLPSGVAGSGAGGPDGVASADVAVPPSPADGVGIDLSGSPTRAPSSAPVPTEIDIPAIGVHAAVVTLGRNPDGTLQVPGRFDVTGWYGDGPRPGDAGPAVIVGHVDSFVGPAVFFRLRDLVAGELINVSGSARSGQFRVESVATFAKNQFPTDLIFGPVPTRALRLITCGGSFDDVKHSYRANVVVFAVEVPA
jgi:sortase (surface protein transpeptidase)